tara:strand:+ start:6945 stop:7325 length:381 start_codon:yes stop_codon:yes gene_type:complete
MIDFRVLEVASNMMGVEIFGGASKGDVVYEFEGEVSSIQTTTSIQISKYEHVEDSLMRYFNHSCDPNMEFVIGEEKFQLVAIKDIGDGDEVTFDYRTTEELLHHPFKCRCCDKLIMKGKIWYEWDT